MCRVAHLQGKLDLIPGYEMKPRILLSRKVYHKIIIGEDNFVMK